MPDKTPELLMPVSDEQAIKQFEIEALRQLTDNLRRLNTHAEKTNEALTRTNDALHAIDIRLTRIESNSVNSDVEKLKSEIESLKLDKASRSGAVQTVEWIGKVGPWLLSLVLGVVALAGWGRST